MTVKGQIQKIEVSEGLNEKTKKPWKRWSYTIDNKKYSTFDIRIGEAFKAGDYVEINLVKNGEYWNMASMVKCNPEASNSQIEPIRQDSDILRQILAEIKDTNQLLAKIFVNMDLFGDNNGKTRDNT